MLLEARDGAWWDAGKIGLGPPPLETPEGWLMMYHGVHLTAAGPIYRVGLTLLDLDDPRRVMHRSEEWVFGPEAPYERSGDVADVVFPNGWVIGPDPKDLHIYYGAADSVVAMATADLPGRGRLRPELPRARLSGTCRTSRIRNGTRARRESCLT